MPIKSFTKISQSSYGSRGERIKPLGSSRKGGILARLFARKKKKVPKRLANAFEPPSGFPSADIGDDLVHQVVETRYKVEER